MSAANTGPDLPSEAFHSQGAAAILPVLALKATYGAPYCAQIRLTAMPTKEIEEGEPFETGIESACRDHRDFQKRH